MSLTLNERCRNMILGALVADAATMGLHWIYDQDRIREVAPDTPEFTETDAAHFRGVPAFFAHGSRTAGDFSQYGEQAALMLNSLAGSEGEFDPITFAAHFRSHFGYGGAYVGYIDHATRDTLDNFRRFEDAVYAACKEVLSQSDTKLIKAIANGAVPVLVRHGSETLSGALSDAIHHVTKEPDVLVQTDALQAAFQAIPKPTGAHDIQLPATAKLPALIAALAQKGITSGPQFDAAVASAVRVTSDHATADAYSNICAHMMAAALLQGSVDEAIAAARVVASAEADTLLSQALEMRGQDTNSATKHFGMACDLPFGVPSALHNIATASSYTQAVRRNIYAGGDNCGRAIIVGAVMGAIHGIEGESGIPETWIRRLTMHDPVMQSLSRIFPL